MHLERLTILFFVALLINGCTTVYSDGPFELIEGTYFDSDLINTIKDGETAEDRLYADFGTPQSVNIDKDGGKIVTYKCVEKRVSEITSLFRHEKSSQTIDQALTATILNGVVVHHEYTKKIY